LLGVFGFSFLVVLTAQLGKIGLLAFAALSLLILSIERLGKRVAAERIEGWQKLLRVTPLSPKIYLAAKVVVALVLLTVNLLLIFLIVALRIDLEESLFSWVRMFSSLLFGVIPFAILGLALGYLFKPKTVDSIIGLSLPVALLTCGLPLPYPADWVQDLGTFSPFYHYAQLAVWSGGLDAYDGQIVLHLLWLLWAGFMFGFVAIWAYERDRLLE
jgi:ABC-2 type transport system ATP-binding protein